MDGLDLFSGIGGITIALQDYITPMAYCEIDSYAQSVLLQRMQEGNLPKAPIWDDIRTLSAKELPEIDIIYGGFPCQDISVAGRQKGLGGERSGLFFEILRLIDEAKPPFIFLENVPNIRTKGAERVCKELAERGYDCRWCMLSASDVGARHKRERWFLLAHSKCEGSRRDGLDEELQAKSESVQSKDRETYSNDVEPSGEILANSKSKRTREDFERIWERSCGDSEDVSDSSSMGCNERSCEEIRSKESKASREDASYNGKTYKHSDWTIEPDVGRVVNGLPNRVDRIKALGNSVVPLQVREAFKILKE